MAFAKVDVDDLLVNTGRMCAICNRPHGVQVHHIIPLHSGGNDEKENMIPLCPNCHDEVHTKNAPGRTTRAYSENELRGHLKRTIQLARKQLSLRPGNEDWAHDVELMRFYSMCIDRPAFRTRFHLEVSFNDLDQALEDTVLALNTGLWRTRDGMVIERAQGKRALVNPEWREGMDRVVSAVTDARQVLRRSLQLDREFVYMRSTLYRLDEFHERCGHDSAVGREVDAARQRAVDTMNELLAEAGLAPLKALGDWS